MSLKANHSLRLPGPDSARRLIALPAVLVALALALTSGCSVFAPKGPSEVARGEYYAAGKPEFDSFFIALHQKQVELAKAPAEPAEARRTLTQALGLTPSASDDSLSERLGQELEQLSARGLRVRLELPEPSSALDASAILYTSDSGTESPLRTTLPEVATRLVRSQNRMLAAKGALDKLRVDGITLDGGVDQAFRVDGPWKRSEVRQNLADGQKVITLMQARAADIVQRDQRLLALLGKVAVTDASLGRGPSTAPARESEPPKPARHASARRSAPAARPSPRAPKPSPPAASPAVKRDEPPAPKAVHGNAPAAIEP